MRSTIIGLVLVSTATFSQQVFAQNDQDKGRVFGYCYEVMSHQDRKAGKKINRGGGVLSDIQNDIRHKTILEKTFEIIGKCDATNTYKKGDGEAQQACLRKYLSQYDIGFSQGQVNAFNNLEKPSPRGYMAVDEMMMVNCKSELKKLGYK